MQADAGGGIENLKLLMLNLIQPNYGKMVK